MIPRVHLTNLNLQPFHTCQTCGYGWRIDSTPFHTTNSKSNKFSHFRFTRSCSNLAQPPASILISHLIQHVNSLSFSLPFVPLPSQKHSNSFSSHSVISMSFYYLSLSLYKTEWSPNQFVLRLLSTGCAIILSERY